MPTNRGPDKQWDLLINELRDFQDDRQESLGGVDDMLIARYLAGECDDEERALVEDASQRFPEIRECIDLAHEALIADGPSVPVYATMGATEVTAATTVLDKTGRSFVGRGVSHKLFAGSVPSWAAAACLLIAIGLGWALTTQLSQMNSQLVALQTSQEDFEKNRPVASANSEVQALEKQLHRLRAKIDELGQMPHSEAPTVTKRPEPPSVTRSPETAVTAIREAVGTTPYTRRLTMPYTSYYSSEAAPTEGRTQANKSTGYHFVRETGASERRATLPRDILDTPPALPLKELLSVLGHTSDLVRWAAADALSRTANGESKAEARAAVIEMLKKRDDQGRAAADYVLNGRIAEGFGTDLSESSRVALASPDRIVCWAGLHYFLVVRQCFEDKEQTVLSPTYFPPGFVAKIVDQLIRITKQKDEDPLLYKTAVYLLGQFNGEAKPALNDLVRIVESDCDPQTRRWAAYAIGQIGPEAKAVVPALGRLLLKETSQADNKIDETVFPAVAYAYGELYSGEKESGETKKVAATLIDCLGNASPNISYWSAYALWKINDPAPSVLPGGQSGGYSNPPPSLSSPGPHTSTQTYQSPAPGYSVPPLPAYHPPGSAPPTTVARPPTPASANGEGTDSSRDARKTNSKPSHEKPQRVQPVPTPAPPHKIDVEGWRPSRG